MKQRHHGTTGAKKLPREHYLNATYWHSPHWLVTTDP